MRKWKTGQRASLTVEASLILPVVLLAIISFIYFFQIVLIHEEVQKGISEVARMTSGFAYIYDDLRQEDEESADTNETVEENSEDDTGNDSSQIHSLMSSLATGVGYNALFDSKVDTEFLNHSWIRGGCSGILFVSSKFMKDNEDIDIVAAYQIKIPFTIFGEKTINCVQRVKTRGFVGVSCVMDQENTDDEEEEDDPYVYVTETGSVYHITRNCPSLNLRISSCQGRNLAAKRNQSGGKYRPCERCMRHMELNPDDTYFVTQDGDRYHCDRACSGLKRTTRKIHLSEAAGKRPCKRCSQ